MPTEQSKTPKASLPESITSGMFLIIGSGETYQSKIVHGTDLFPTMMEWIYGDNWQQDVASDHIAAYWEELCDVEHWGTDNDCGPIWWKTDVGETDHIEINRITDINSIAYSQGLSDGKVIGREEGMKEAAEFAKLKEDKGRLELAVDNFLAEGRPHGGRNTQFPDGCECDLCQNWDALNRERLAITAAMKGTK